MGRHMIDLTGRKFGKLTVIKICDIKNWKRKRPHWLCQCECGNITISSSSNLLSGQSQSCGCDRKNNISKAKFKDLTGRKFGKLTVLGIDYDKTKPGKYFYKCQCECGNKITVFAGNLRSGSTSSCGCGHMIDLKGQKFGRLTVLELDREKTTYGTTYWLCQCECGTIKSVEAYNLKSGHIKSCGCLSKELTSKRSIKRNFISFDSERNCYKAYFFNCKDVFYFDKEDLDIIKSYCWRKSNTGYVVSYIVDDNGKYHSYQLHRAIMSKYNNIDGLIVDHINHNILDNRKCNLRIGNSKDNLNNKRPLSNTGEKYISYNIKRKKYYVQFSKDNVCESFIILEDAIRFRDKYLNDHYDEFRYNPKLDYINKRECIYPIIFINPDTIINPFVEVNKPINPFEEVTAPINPFIMMI